MHAIESISEARKVTLPHFWHRNVVSPSYCRDNHQRDSELNVLFIPPIFVQAERARFDKQQDKEVTSPCCHDNLHPRSCSPDALCSCVLLSALQSKA